MESLPDNAVLRYSAHTVDTAPPSKWEHSSAVVTHINKAIGKLCEAYRTKKSGEMVSHAEYTAAKKSKTLGKMKLGFCGNCDACWRSEVKTISYLKH